MAGIDVRLALSIGASLLSLAAFAVALILYRGLRQWRGRCLALEARLPALHRQVDALLGSDRLASQRAFFVAHPRRAAVTACAQARPVDAAIASARRGADVRLLTRQFGLSRGEAELITRLHGCSPR